MQTAEKSAGAYGTVNVPPGLHKIIVMVAKAEKLTIPALMQILLNESSLRRRYEKSRPPYPDEG